MRYMSSSPPLSRHPPGRSAPRPPTPSIKFDILRPKLDILSPMLGIRRPILDLLRLKFGIQSPVSGGANQDGGVLGDQFDILHRPRHPKP